MLRPFSRFCVRIGAIPESIIKSLSYEEQLIKLILFLKEEVLPAINDNAEAVEELQTRMVELETYVKNYFEDLDVQEEINTKLDEMASDGTLASLIGQYISINNVNYLEQVAVLQYRPSTGDDIGMQGGCYAGDGNIVQYVRHAKKIQVISLSTGQVLREATNVNYGHGNSLCLVDGYIYLSGLKETGTTTNTIYKINYNDLSDVTEIDIYNTLNIPSSVNLFTITYDVLTERWYMLKANIIPTCNIYVFNKDFTSYEVVTLDNSTNYGGPIVNTCMYNGYYCIFYNYGKLTMYDKNFNVYKNIQIEKEFGSRYASEFEWLSQYNDKELLFGIVGSDGKDYGGGNFLYAKCNLYSSNKNYSKGNNPNNLSGKNPNIQTLYVDSEIETLDVTRDGSLEKPFVSLYELSNALLTSNINICFIHGDFTNEGLYINNCNNVKIYNWLQDDEENSLIPVRELEVENVDQCYLRYIYPINNISIKEAKALLKYDSLISNNEVLSLQVYNTGHLIFDVDNNVLTVTNTDGINEGIIETTNFVRVNGLAKWHLSSTSEDYNDYCSCKNIKNMMTRGRWEGTWTNPTTYEFSCPRANIVPVVRLSSEGWLELPFTVNSTETIPLASGDTLTYVVATDSSDSDLVKITLTTTTEKIWDVLIKYN